MNVRWKVLTGVMAAMTMGGAVQAATWDVSADLRERYQSFNNLDFNSAKADSHSEFDSRLFLKAKADFGNGLSVYLQPQAVVIKDRTTANGSQNFTQADLYQAYLQYHISDFSVRLGRQQLVYGDQRLLGHLGWKDVARTFDGVKAFYKNDSLKLDVFSVHPADIANMTPKTGATQGKSLVTWEDRLLTGVYATYTMAPKTGVDAYVINWNHSNKAAVGAGRNINTFGTRLFGKWSAVDATAETVFQRGTWKTGVTQSASAYAVKAGYTFDAWKTRLGVEYDYSPGDNKTNAKTHKDFVFPFHTNHAHYGEMDRFSWANMKDIRFSAKTSPVKGLSLIANMHLLYLAEAKGDWLNVVGTKALFAGKSTYTKTKAGTEIDLKVVYKVAAMKGLKLVGNYSTFNPGAAVRERNAGKADKATFSYLFAQYAF